MFNDRKLMQPSAKENRDASVRAILSLTSKISILLQDWAILDMMASVKVLFDKFKDVRFGHFSTNRINIVVDFFNGPFESGCE
jgi:hypothetical protein